MRRTALAFLALVPLAGCAAAGPAITSLATAGVAGGIGSATGSAAVGVAAGFAVSVGVDQAVKWGERRIAENVQGAVAQAAGPLDVGQSAPWEVEAKLPFSARSGTVEVARSFGVDIPCKDIVFTLQEDKARSIYTSTVCRNDAGEWRWALAEPSIYRWGYLQ